MQRVMERYLQSTYTHYVDAGFLRLANIGG